MADSMTPKRSQVFGPFVRTASGLIVPPSTLPRPDQPLTGPQFVIAASKYEGNLAEATDVLWSVLPQHSASQWITAFAGVNLLISQKAFGGWVHDWLHANCVGASDRHVLETTKGQVQNLPLVFSRVGNLVAMKIVIAHEGHLNHDDTGPLWLQIGEAVMAANAFLTGTRFREGKGSSDDDLIMIEQLASWEVSNQRDVAYSVARARLLLTKYLTSGDHDVLDGCSALSIDPNDVTVAGIPLAEYFAIVTAQYSALSTISPEQLLDGTRSFRLDVGDFASRTSIPVENVRKFFAQRARTADELRADICAESPRSIDETRKAISTDSFIGDFRAFRKTPFVWVDQDIAVALDRHFVAELLAVGLYWAMFDAVEPRRRPAFAQLWGRLFHLYVADLLRFNYPEGLASPLRVEAAFQRGSADALLDFDDYIVVFEFKGSLLTHAAKSNRDFDAFDRDFKRKFYETEDGERKGLKQLAAAALAAQRGELVTNARPKAIYPVLVSYESAVESFFVNTYANRLFQPLIGDSENIRPVTLISIEELESVLPRMITDGLTWSELLEYRFSGNRVRPESVSQIVYDWAQANHLSPSRNEFLLSAYQRAFEESVEFF